MCDADADGNVYVYSILTGDLLEGAGGKLIGLHLTAGRLRGRAAADRRDGVRRHLGNGGDGGKVLDGLEADPGLRHRRAERRRSHLSLQPRAMP